MVNQVTCQTYFSFFASYTDISGKERIECYEIGENKTEYKQPCLD